MRKILAIFLDILLKILYIKPIYRLLKKYKILVLIVFIIAFYVLIEWLKTFHIEELLAYKKSLLYLTQDHPLSLSLLFFISYMLIAIISLPGTTVINVIGGFLFGFLKGTLLSVFAVSIGTGIAFLLTRYFFHDFFMKKAGNKMKKVYKHLKKKELYYLFAFRLFPFIPLFFTNIIMGLSSMRFRVFYVVSVITLLPQLAIYANIGSQLSQLESFQGLIEARLLFAFSLIGLFPLCVNFIFWFLKKIKKTPALESNSATFS